jgi:signal transduction histidine kinase
VKIFDVFAELHSIFQVNNQNSDVEIILDVNQNDKKLSFETDKSKLDKILSNLLENSLKFTKKGFVKFGYKSTDNELLIFVEDSGIGIEEGKQELIFNRFIRGNIEEGFAYSGLGLGLSIVKENTELLEGKISLKSELDKGSRFEILFKKS